MQSVSEGKICFESGTCCHTEKEVPDQTSYLSPGGSEGTPSQAGLALTQAAGPASLAEWLRRPPREQNIRGSNPACDGIFPGPSHTSDLKNGTPVATLPGTWYCRVSARTGRPGISIV